MATGDLLSIQLEGGFIGQTANNGQQILDAKANTFNDWASSARLSSRLTTAAANSQNKETMSPAS